MNIRKLAYDTLMAVDYTHGYSNLETQRVLNNTVFKAEDKNLYLKLVYGCIQNRLFLDAILTPYAKKKMDPEIRTILRISLYQMYCLDKVPDYALVNEAVTLAEQVKPRAKGFVNGVLRNILRDEKPVPDLAFCDNEKEALSIGCSVPLWIVYKYFEVYGKKDGEAILKKVNETPPLTLRVNTLKLSREMLMDKLTDAGIGNTAGVEDEDAVLINSGSGFATGIEDSEFYKSGYFTVQDQGAMKISRLLGPKDDDCVLDMCAAPGGKTTHLAQLMKNKGKIEALDIYPKRLKLVKNTAKRLGVSNIQYRCGDGREVPAEAEEYYDKILLDAPCSGLGIIRRKPEIRYRITKEDRRSLVTLQRELLDAAYDQLVPGGTLIYSTCTVNRDENENQIKGFLEKYPQMMLSEDGYIYTTPLRQNSDCFFMCKLIKS